MLKSFIFLGFLTLVGGCKDDESDSGSAGTKRLVLRTTLHPLTDGNLWTPGDSGYANGYEYMQRFCTGWGRYQTGQEGEHFAFLFINNEDSNELFEFLTEKNPLIIPPNNARDRAVSFHDFIAFPHLNPLMTPFEIDPNPFIWIGGLLNQEGLQNEYEDDQFCNNFSSDESGHEAYAYFPAAENPENAIKRVTCNKQGYFLCMWEDK